MNAAEALWLLNQKSIVLCFFVVKYPFVLLPADIMHVDQILYPSMCYTVSKHVLIVCSFHLS